MPQKTNLNTSPYYDDYDSSKNFYKVLFKPGHPVQARELTTLQSILQNQVESFGSHIFKEGSMVIPGSITYDGEYYAVKINSTHLGVDVSSYAPNLIGKRILGETTRNTAVVRNILLENESDEGYLTLYVKYIESDLNLEFTSFSDGENLILLDTITFGTSTISSGETFSTTIQLNSTAIGSAVFISDGIYFIRGTFVNVTSDSIILDQYSNTPSYRIGLSISESIVTAKEDNTLYDNAKGFSNYSAPGADRFRITTNLSKKNLDDITDDKNFVEILRVINGNIKQIQDKTEYSSIRDYLAKRTYEESGNYSVSQFSIDVENSLNDRINSDGLFFETQTTPDGNIPSDDLLCIKVSPGKAYVRGYDIDKNDITFIDSEKPRDTGTIESSYTPFEMGNLLKVNNVSGNISFGTDSDYYVYLQNGRKNSTTVGSGTTIGIARAYSLNLSDSSYSDSSTQWDLYLYDIQTYTEITLNDSLDSSSCPRTSYIVGKSSNASGYTIENASSDKILLIQTSGNFNVGERIMVNGLEKYPRSIKEIKSYNVSDIKSLHQPTSVSGLSTAFIADSVLEKKLPNNFSISDRIFINSSGIATCPGKNFLGIRSDTIIRYQRTGLTTETFNKVDYVSPDGSTLFLSGITTVFGVCDGGLPAQTEFVSFTIGDSQIKNQDNASLYTKLSHENISDVSLSNSNLVIQQQIESTTTSNGELVITLGSIGLSNVFFEAYDSERYHLTYSDGTTESLTDDQFIMGSGSESFTIYGLRPSQNISIKTTLRKFSIKNKAKQYVRSRKLTVDKTNNEQSTVNSGLSYNQYYGLRIEDREISLNVPDVVKIIGIFESLDLNVPILDKLTFLSSNNLNVNSILGEKIQGLTSGSIAQIVTNNSSDQIEICYLNSSKFILGETVRFLESNIDADIQLITPGKYLNRTNSYRLDKGQKDQYYDFSKIIKNSSETISRQLLIIYDSFSVPSTDSGDIYTVKSYPESAYGKDIPFLSNNIRSSDVLDFRPRVAEFTSSNSSPFSFYSKNFSNVQSNTSLTLSPNESSLIGYSYYLSRIDRLVLNKNGEFKIIKGNPALNPDTPNIIEDSMTIGIIHLPAYLYSPQDAKVRLVDNQRFTMRELGEIEDRVTNLERITTLSLLELDTKTLQIQDADGLNRFKCGFFVDDFKDFSFTDTRNVDLKCVINSSENELRTLTDTFSVKPQLVPAQNLDINSIDLDNSDYVLYDQNVRKTGDFVTLQYTEIPWDNLTQLIATRIENVNPFSIVEYVGNMKLNPASDTWIRDIVINRGATRFTWGGWNGTFLENVLRSTEQDRFMRSRNVEFNVTSLKPLTRYFSFLDKNNTIDIIPKLLQISMVSGQFSTGEIIDGFDGSNRLISFRLCQQNHKKGPFNSPVETYNANPFNTSIKLSGYSASTTVINIDTTSLAQESLGRFSGYVVGGMTLIGRTSRAQAVVSDRIDLVSDTYGDVIGCFFIRDPNTPTPPPLRITTGTKKFKVSSSLIDAEFLPKGFIVNSAETDYRATGIVRTFETVAVTVRVPPPPPPPPPPPRPPRRGDPLAQTFTTDFEGGFLTSMDLYFFSKDPVEKLTVELRTVDLGVPTNQFVQDYSRIELLPEQIFVSDNSETPTRITFPSPIYLEPNTEYAIVLRTPTSDQYNAWIARMGERSVNTQDLPDAEGVVYARQYTGGSLFKSQNGTVWTANQFEDLKFRLYKASFNSNVGTVYFNNPSLLESKQDTETNLYNTVPDPITTYPRKLIVGIETSTTLNSIFTIGTKVGTGNTVNGILEFIGGNISGITTTNSGIGYSSGGPSIYSNVPLYNITGNGSGATATVTVLNENVSSISIASSGNGYVVGDVLGITTSSVTKGTGCRITISETNGIDTLYLTNVVGEKFNSGDTLVYYDGLNPVSLAGTITRRESEVLSPIFEGNVFEVYQYSHGMHSDTNEVIITNVMPNTPPISLVDSIGINTATTVSVGDTSLFVQYEGINVSAANTGYVQINNEIIGYDSVGDGVLNISLRGVDGSIERTHDIGNLLYKYELNGVSLLRINKTHNMSDFSNNINSLKTLDTYLIQFDNSPRNAGVNYLSFNDEKTVGGNSSVISHNLQFNSITPYLNILTPGFTSVQSRIRTVSSTSSDGNEPSFIDQGYESIELNQENSFNTPRMVCSRVNEISKLSNLPRNKSLTLAIDLESPNSNLSPIIDLREGSTMILTRNRINKPVLDYIGDSSANLLQNDPHASIYISNRIDLKQPATSLKVFISAYRDEESDFRVLYRLFKSDSSEIDQPYQLFPGYKNMIDIDGDGFGDIVIDQSLNTGEPDNYVRPSRENEFLDYQFTADNLDQFNGFVIKIVMSSTNESKPPRFKDLRVVALA